MKDAEMGLAGPGSLWGGVRGEWTWWLPGAILSFFLASVLMSGWPDGLIPNLVFPYIYHGDGLSHSWLLQRTIEGWIFDNPRSGYPFGSNFLDYPGSDSGSILLLKVLGLLAGEYHSALNLFFLLSFPTTFLAAFCVLRAIGLNRAFALSAATIFTFLPFHFLRLGHLFYLWYFVVPIFFYVGFSLFYESYRASLGRWRFSGFLLIGLAFVILASFGVYYALFGIIIIGVSGLAGWVRSGKFHSFWAALLVILLVGSGVLVNLGPHLVHTKINGPNPEVAVRSPAEAEIYGFKLRQLILPRPSHRDAELASMTNKYNATYPLVNENSTASLGFVGTAGFIFLGVLLLVNLSGGQADTRLSLLALIVYVLFMFGTIGGLGSLFSAVISPSFRGWNRISVFIAFGSVAAFFLALQIWLKVLIPAKRQNLYITFVALAILWLGLYDQTIPACRACNDQTRIAFERDRDFIRQIEKSVPAGSPIYQLPYMPFPEVAPLHRMHLYDQVVGFLHSKTLHWNHAGMKGREGDLFYRSLAQEPIDEQIKVIKQLGFAGIYIDRKGFGDNAQALIKGLSSALGEPPFLERADREVVFFRIETPTKPDLMGSSSLDIMKKAGYIVDKLGKRYLATLLDGIDFTNRSWPDFVSDFSGLSGPEPWGRWSDGNLAATVKIAFYAPLPRKFNLVMSAQALGPNAGQEVLVKLGKQQYRATFRHGLTEVRIPVDLAGELVNVIEFVPPQPVTPKSLGINEDIRKLGIGFVSLRFEEKP